MKIKIDGLDPTDILLALYNHARFEGPRFHDRPLIVKHIPAKGDWDPAAALIDQRDAHHCDLSFDGVDLGAGVRPLYVDLSDIEFDSDRYDRCHGIGLAAKVIASLRDAYVQEFEQSKDKARDFKKLLWQVNQKVQEETASGQLDQEPDSMFKASSRSKL